MPPINTFRAQKHKDSIGKPYYHENDGISAANVYTIYLYIRIYVHCTVKYTNKNHTMYESGLLKSEMMMMRRMVVLCTIDDGQQK